VIGAGWATITFRSYGASSGWIVEAINIRLLTEPDTRFSNNALLLFTIPTAQFALRIERAHSGPPLIIAHQDFYAAFGLIQTILAFARKFHALLEKIETLLEREFTLLQLAHDALEFFQRRLEILWLDAAHWWHRFSL